MIEDLPVSIDDVKKARVRIEGVAHVTPIFSSRTIGDLCGHSVFLKPESLQRVGAFKFRGAYNKVASMSKEEREKGLVTHSSGNHAQALALAGSLFNVPVTVVMPTNAPKVKVDAVNGYGGIVEFCGTTNEERKARALELVSQEGHILVPPYDDPHIVAGQGTIGLEVLEQVPDVNAVVVPIGGGGLISGIALAIKSLRPDVKVFGVESVGAPGMYLSLKNGEITHCEQKETIADGLLPSAPGIIPFAIGKECIDNVVLVNDNEIKEALKILLLRAKLVVEPSGAVSVAALLNHRIEMEKGSNVVAVLSGGNIEPKVLLDVLKDEG